MSKGRKPLTDSMRRAKGRPPKPREEDHPGLSIPASIPDCPPQLNEAARNEWIRISPYLLSARRVGQVDRQSLAGYCIAYAYWQDAARAILVQSLPLEDSWSKLWGYTSAEKPRAVKMVDIFLKYGAEVINSAARFGMTARTRHLDHKDTGRPSLPDELHEVRGNPSRKKLRGAYVDAITEVACKEEPPAGILDDESHDEYLRLMHQLDKINLFTVFDVAPLAVAAGTWGLAIMASQELNDSTLDLPTPDMAVEHPCSKIFRLSQVLLAASWKEYGMTPLDRKRFQSTGTAETAFKPKVYVGA